MKGAIIYDVTYLRMLQERIAELIEDTERLLGCNEAFPITKPLAEAYGELSSMRQRLEDQS